MQDKNSPARGLHVHPAEMIKSYEYIHKHTTYNILQTPLFKYLLVALNAITGLEVIECCKRDTALGVFAHLFDVFFLVLERTDNTCVVVSIHFVSVDSRPGEKTYRRG